MDILATYALFLILSISNNEHALNKDVISYVMHKRQEHIHLLAYVII